MSYLKIRLINTTNLSQTNPKISRILLISSLPRSGSTWIANLLTSYPKSMLILEPFRGRKTLPVKDVIKSIFLCNHFAKFHWIKRNDNLFTLPFEGRTCQSQMCLNKQGMDNLCKNAELVLAKVFEFV